MSIEVKLPELGEGIDSGDVLSLLVNEGDVIKKEQGIIELETDKATVEVPSTHAGKVSKIHVSAGQSVGVGTTLITLEADDAKTDKEESKPAPVAEEKKAKEKEEIEETEFESESEETAEEEAHTPKKEKSEAKAEREEEKSAKPKEERQQKKFTAATEDDEEPERAKKSTTTKPTPAQVPSHDDGATIAAGPAIRRFAREVGVDLAYVKGTGEGGRITRDDVLAVVRHASQAARGEAKATESDQWGPIRTERLSKMRRTIAAKMHESWTTVPRVTNFDDADITELEEFRQQSKEDYAGKGIKLTQLPFVIKAVAMSLKKHPNINAALDLPNEQMIYKQYVNIGIAVDSERGLVVPSLRGADDLSISEIASELSTLAEKVRTNEFSIDDLRGGTFTISNLGAVGGTYSTPIVNVPEVAILLVGRSRKMPIVMKDDSIKVRLMMPLSLSYDHRLVDGATAARFLNEVIGYLEAPTRLLLAP